MWPSLIRSRCPLEGPLTPRKIPEQFEEKTRKEILRAWAYEAGIEQLKPTTRKVKDWRSWVKDMGAPAGAPNKTEEKTEK